MPVASKLHDTRAMRAGEVSVAGLGVAYRTGGGQPVRALDGVDLEIAGGEFACVMGPSGSGKSTLLHALSGLLVPTSGVVRVGGVEVHALADAAATRFRRRHVGLVFQFFNLVPTLDVERNAALPLLADGARLSEVRDRVRAMLERLGVGHLRGHSVSELSGGEMQRVALARALVAGPELILADEPTGSLDSKTGHEILALLRGLCDDAGITVVLMTHDPRAVGFADRLVEIRDGRLVRDLPNPGAGDVA